MALVFNVITMTECVILQENVLWYGSCVLHVVGSVILTELMVCA